MIIVGRLYGQDILIIVEAPIWPDVLWRHNNVCETYTN